MLEVVRRYNGGQLMLTLIEDYHPDACYDAVVYAWWMSALLCARDTAIGGRKRCLKGS